MVSISAAADARAHAPRRLTKIPSISSCPSASGRSIRSSSGPRQVRTKPLRIPAAISLNPAEMSPPVAGLEPGHMPRSVALIRQMPRRHRVIGAQRCRSMKRSAFSVRRRATRPSLPEKASQNSAATSGRAVLSGKSDLDPHTLPPHWRLSDVVILSRVLPAGGQGRSDRLHRAVTSPNRSGALSDAELTMSKSPLPAHPSSKGMRHMARPSCWSIVPFALSLRRGRDRGRAQPCRGHGLHRSGHRRCVAQFTALQLMQRERADADRA